MSTPIPDATLQELETAARTAAGRAYAPYSKFCVGAAVLGDSGKIHSGCNVENASFGLTSCAERNAIFAAVGAGERAIRAVAIYTPTSSATAPCGACRQVIREFGPDAIIISICDGDSRIESTIGELLPRSFGPEDLN
ncbi:MAG TPA: cytidine deaminase [Opitutaceae bacterium]|nr:cytidine deaminase [Opitutaceae bacterium]